MMRQHLFVSKVSRLFLLEYSSRIYKNTCTFAAATNLFPRDFIAEPCKCRTNDATLISPLLIVSASVSLAQVSGRTQNGDLRKGH